MKHLIITTITAVMLVGCGTTQQPKPPTAKAPDISIHKAAEEGNIEAVKKHLAAGTDVNARVTRKYTTGWTVLHFAAEHGHWEIADFLRKHGGKRGAELKAEGK